MVHSAGNLFWRTITRKMTITAAAEPPSSMSPCVGLGFVGRKGGKLRRKARGEKRVDQEDFEMGEVPQDMNKRGIGAFGLSLRE